MGPRALIFAAALLAQPAISANEAANETAPSFDCAQKRTSSVEQRICKDPKLAALDRQLGQAYAAAQGQATPADAQTLTNAQRDWVRTRNACWKNADVPACVENAYHDRISELQARYRLVAPVGSARYLCPGPPAQEVVADYFATDPPTAMVQYAGATQFMRVARSGSGARYTGGNRQLWEHQGVAMLNWGASTQELRCPKQ